MSFFTEADADLQALRALVGADTTADAVPGAVRASGPSAAHEVVARTASLIARLTMMQTCAAAVIADASKPDAGHNGFAQTKGHRSPVTLVQELTGTTKADAAKKIRAGEALLATSATPAVDTDTGPAVAALPVAPWFAPIGDALRDGRLTVEQHDAIRRGLGDPPTPPDSLDPGQRADALADATEVWRTAADHLVAEAAQRSVEELRVASRTVRDVLDPEGAERRYDERHANRYFRSWIDADGIRRGSFACDDDGAALLDTILNAALRPRRGGPRFVDADEAARAKALVDDPRSNDQLAYDLFLDVLRSGTLADVETVFGTKQAGVRVIITDTSLHYSHRAGAEPNAPADADGTGSPDLPRIGIVEDGGSVLPAWIIDQHVCDSGLVPCITDRDGNALYLGREARLFSPAQRIALAIRDGGCRWPGCDRPASYCEAHHLDGFATENGRTDIDRGISVCRFHHMNLHHHGWRITRDGLGEFLLHPPGGRKPSPLPRRIGLRYVWNPDAIPAPRFRTLDTRTTGAGGT